MSGKIPEVIADNCAAGLHSIIEVAFDLAYPSLDGLPTPTICFTPLLVECSLISLIIEATFVNNASELKPSNDAIFVDDVRIWVSFSINNRASTSFGINGTIPIPCPLRHRNLHKCNWHHALNMMKCYD